MSFQPVLEWFRQSPLTPQCCLTLVALYVVYNLVHQLFGKQRKLPPGPVGWPLIGNLTAFLSTSLADKIEEWRKVYGPVFTFRMGPTRMIILNDNESINEALVTRGSDFSGRPLLNSLEAFSGGYRDVAFATYDDCWKYQKKVFCTSLRQYLTGNQLEKRVEAVVEIAAKTIRAQTAPFDLRRLLHFTMLNLIHGLCFDQVLKTNDPWLLKLIDFDELYTENANNGFWEDIVPLLKYWPSKAFSDTLHGHQMLADYVARKIHERKSALETGSCLCLADTVLQAQQDLIDSDHAAQRFMTDEHTKFIIHDTFAAAVETSRCTMDWVFLVLAAYPDVQERVQKEVDQVCGDEIPGKEHRAKLVYTEAVILETMRLYPVVPLCLPHSTIRDSRVAGFHVPSGSTVLVNMLAAMRDPKQYENPMTFNPERFISKETGKISMRNKCFLPFSVGDRFCPGESLGKLQLVYTVAGLMKRFSFSLPEGQVADFTPNNKNVGFRTCQYKVVATTR